MKPVSDFELFSEKELSYQELEMILVGNHAPFTWGKNAHKAVHNSAVLEFLAKTAFLTEQINSSAITLKESIKQKHWERKHGPIVIMANDIILIFILHNKKKQK